jgi:2-phospho-L-lactate guanylyltransferase (CobY/MobA/RfbA family)
MSQSSAPTLLVFTLGAARESARRRLAPAGLQRMETALRQACFDAALAAGRACGCRLAVCSPERGRLPKGVEHLPQRGDDFGTRLEGACAAVGRRRGPLVVVGTDVPGLADRHLREALDLLAGDPRRVVLGPSPDGGVYLLAAAAALPPLGEVRWCRPTTLADLTRILVAAGREVVLLEPLADLDRPADLDRYLSQKGSDRGAGKGQVRARRRPARASSREAPSPPEPDARAVQPYADLLRRALAERRRPPERPALDPPAEPDTPGVTGRAPPFSLLH